ncbi:hypothetical protein [Aquimarina aggregata]|uniref:hypothetical protein n=1 Tax=Aquimarina aggregata TaxID=1642818 RepID=UPI0024922618|nr:hypothetical protein [Aquimarina aggregata]
MNKEIFCGWFLCLISLTVFSQNFEIEGNAIRHSVVAKIKGTNVLYIGELDGSISSYTLKGEKLWRVKTEDPAVLFEIEAHDINNDENDDLLVASGNGKVYCYDSCGTLLWEFYPNHKVRFSEIAVIKNNDKVQVFVGGNDRVLYELDTKGKLVSETKINGTIRKIAAGNFLDQQEQCIFLMTYTHDKFRWQFLGFLDSETKKIIKSLKYKGNNLKSLSKSMITDIRISDCNKDGKDDILFFGDIKFKASFTAINGNFENIAEFNASRKQSQRYAHSQGVFLKNRNEIMFQHGAIIFVLNPEGNLIKSFGKGYGKTVFSDFDVDPESNKLIAGGTVDGGNVIHFFDLKKNNWWTTVHKKEGRMLEVERNLKKLYEQALRFKLPSYQKKSNKEWVMITSKTIAPEVEKLNGTKFTKVIQKAPKESTERSKLVALIGDIALNKDKRGKYQDSREEIIQMARDFEDRKQPFTFWAGHGNDPFYIQIETLEKILEVAPNTCYGFVYAEMDRVDDPRVIHFIKEYIPRLAKAIRKNNRAKLYFRYKNMFWAATSHLPLWKELFFSKKYNDFLIPASEDTSNRIQDLNLAGRVGMLSGGFVNDFAIRLVDDNPTSWRPLSPGGQSSVSPYLRQGVMMAAYGARYGVLFNNKFTEDPGLNVLFALMKSGVLPIVENRDILSIGSWHLIKNVNKELVEIVDKHHFIDQYNVKDDNAVFSVAQMHWAGTTIPDYDFSKIGLGVKYRWLNYMPELPYGMVPIGPIESKMELEKKGIPYFVSNAKQGYIGENKVAADKFGKTIKETVFSGGRALNVLVQGVSWSAIKIDDTHTRLILIDQGYIDPQNRNSIITFQNKEPKWATDILSNEKLKINKKTIKISIPAGSVRFIDLEY